MSSGSYFPPPVRSVKIDKDGEGKRKLGIPTVSDRIAQMVVKRRLEPVVDPLFVADSYGYRPGKSAHEAVGQARQRCWKYDWVVDLDIKGFFDRAGGANTSPTSVRPLRIYPICLTRSSGARCNTTGGLTARGFIHSGDTSTVYSPVGRHGNTRSCASISGGRRGLSWREPRLFAHWQLGAQRGSAMGAL